jgi:hypothetical protein
MKNEGILNGNKILKSDRHLCLGWFMYIFGTLETRSWLKKWKIAL